MRPSILAASAEGKDDSIMSLVIKRLCASLIYNQLESNLCTANIHGEIKCKNKMTTIQGRGPLPPMKSNA